MEAAAGVAAGRGIPSSSSSSSLSSARKEWRAVSEHSVRNTSNEELERTNLGQNDERTIYEQGSRPPDVDFCSVTIEGSSEDDLWQQRLHSVCRRREELQHMEIELRAQGIARSEIMRMQNSFDLQIKEHVNAAAKIKEKLQEREHALHDLELKLEEKDRELRATKIDSEAAWAKEDLLREQNKELATFRRERDNSEAERIQHLQKIHELQEHIQEKERQFLEMEEQHRVAQENIIYRDEQLREAQAWVSRVPEMQAEMRDRIEQFNQYSFIIQRQFGDKENYYIQTIQQLQFELADVRERSGMYADESRMVHVDAKEASQFGHNSANEFNINEGGAEIGNSEVMPNGNVDHIQAFASTGNASSKSEYSPGVPPVQSSLLGMAAYLPPGQMTPLHPFVMQQGVPQSLPLANSHASQSHLGHLQQIPPGSSHIQWQNQQAISEGLHIPNQSQHPSSQTEQSFLSSGAHYDYELSADGHVHDANYLAPHISSSREPVPVITSSNEEAQVVDTNDNSYLVASQTQPISEESSSKVEARLGLECPQQNNEMMGQEEHIVTFANHLKQGESLGKEQLLPCTNPNQTNSSATTASSTSSLLFPEVSVSTRRMTNSPVLGNIPEPILLDERSLLACIVRAIPAGSGGQIRISSTLPNRLGKMLAPLHWHDYKKKYGKLDDFVASHPELFVIEGDFVHLREGAQENISATAAVAKVAAAAAASPSYSSFMPSVAVTPMAQNHRLKRTQSIDSQSATATSTAMGEKSSQLPTVPNQHSNGVGSNLVQGLSNVKILSKPKDSLELNVLKSDVRPGHSSAHVAVANGASTDRTSMSSFQNKGSNNGRHGANFVWKQPGRSSGALSVPRK